MIYPKPKFNLHAGDDIYCHGSLYYCARENPYEETGDSGQGITQDDCWYKVLEVSDDKGAFIQGPRESLWLSWYILNERFGDYFRTLEDMDERQKASNWLKETRDVEILRILALQMPLEKVLEEFRRITK